ncbi:MAG: hypothetical protein DWH91_18720 [Planctomycetota bacterium]|nr:MAG: hypothetical protein DWH91_18720 [Planctomycetota bacterium]
MGRALRLRCPRCGVGKMFSGPLTTCERCSHCRLKYERAPGYFLGSIYINYGLTAMATTVSYVVLHVILGWTNRQLTFPLTGFCMVFPALAFRHTRALWLALDCHWDESLMEIEEE